MSDTVKYSDELLTSDEFIKKANENNDKNLQLQKDLAKKVYENTYVALERQYNETATSAGVAKERNLVDADTAYKLNDVKYGAEAEAMGRMGLTGSGMGEYREAQAYAQNRADRQATYAEYDRVMREAAYNRDQGKLDAEVKYSDAVTNAEIKHNETATAISEKELGYAEGERATIDSSFSAFIDGINDGSMTLDEIMADSYWPKLSPEQQKTITQRAKVKGFKSQIDNGKSLEEIESAYGWAELTNEQREEISGYYSSVQAAKTKEAGAAYGSYVEMAQRGYSIDVIVNQAKTNGHYDSLVEAGLWTSIEDEAENYANKQSEAKIESDYNTALGLLADGWTMEEIKAHLGEEAWAALEASGQSDKIQNASDVMARIKSETEGKTAKESLLTYLDLAATGKYTLDELKAIAQSLGHYDALNNAGYWAQVEGKVNEIESENTNNENRTNIEDAIANGATLEDVQKMDGWNELGETEQNAYKDAIEASANETERTSLLNLPSYLSYAEMGYSFDEIKRLAGADYDTLVKLGKWDLVVEATALYEYENAEINNLKDLNTLLKDYPENVRDKFVSAFSEENRKLLYEELVANESLQGILSGTNKSSDEILYNIERAVDVSITNEDRWKLFEDAVDCLISRFEASMNGKGLTAAQKVALERIITHLEDKGHISVAYAAKIYELTNLEPAPETPSSNWNMTGGNLFVM